MGELLSAFGNAAQNLARNPLGIIALFIVLVYGFAALVVGPFGAHLSDAQKWPLILFLVLFPLLVLTLFAYLVIRHHAKLYAPSDYRTDEAFMQAQTPEEQAHRINSEVLASYDEERARANQQSHLHYPDAKQIQNTKQVYILSEDLALRQIEAETNEPIKRQVALQAGEKRLRFDGAISKGNEITIIEVKYAQRLPPTISLTKSLVNMLGVLSNYLRSSGREITLKLLLILVTPYPINDPTFSADRLAQDISGPGFTSEVRVFNLEELMKRFGINKSA